MLKKPSTCQLRAKKMIILQMTKDSRNEKDILQKMSCGKAITLTTLQLITLSIIGKNKII